MSIFWYVDEGSRPARFEARLTLIVLERTPVPIPELWPTIDAAGPERRGQCGDADYFAERVGPKWHRR